MTKKGKATEISEKYGNGTVFPTEEECIAYSSAMEMAEWKDEQLKKVCSRCEKHMALHGEMCPWRLLKKTYCWED